MHSRAHEFCSISMFEIWFNGFQNLAYHEGLLAPKSPKRICFHLCNDIADREEAHLMVKRSGLQRTSCSSGKYFDFSSFTSWWNCYGFYSSEILWINHAAGYAYLGLLNCANWAQQESKEIQERKCHIWCVKVIFAEMSK